MNRPTISRYLRANNLGFHLLLAVWMLPIAWVGLSAMSAPVAHAAASSQGVANFDFWDWFKLINVVIVPLVVWFRRSLLSAMDEQSAAIHQRLESLDRHVGEIGVKQETLEARFQTFLLDAERQKQTNLQQFVSLHAYQEDHRESSKKLDRLIQHVSEMRLAFTERMADCRTQCGDSK